MNLYERYIEPFRRRVLSLMGLDTYVTEKTFVGQYNGSVEEFESFLRDLGFNRNPLAYLKRHIQYGVSEGTWALRESVFSDIQLHVTVLGYGGVTYVYAHLEDNWIIRPFSHLREGNIDKQGGVFKMKNLLKMYGVEMDYT